MPVRIVQSKQNARLKELRRALAQPSRSLAGIEGPNLLVEALRARLPIHCVFVAQGSEHLLEAVKLPAETEVLLLSEELLTSALATEAPQPVAALVEPLPWTWRDLLESSDGPETTLIVILAGLQDPGNLGAILRSAEAFGASGVVALPGTANEWNPKTVRASAGSVFRMPLVAAGVDKCFAHLRQAGVKIWTTAVHSAEAAHGVDLAGPVALLIGNEGSGVPQALAAQADGALTIPCPGPVESLNAAVAASVLLYEASQQRSARQVSRNVQEGRR